MNSIEQLIDAFYLNWSLSVLFFLGTLLLILRIHWGWLAIMLYGIINIALYIYHDQIRINIILSYVILFFTCIFGWRRWSEEVKQIQVHQSDVLDSVITKPKELMLKRISGQHLLYGFFLLIFLSAISLTTLHFDLGWITDTEIITHELLYTSSLFCFVGLIFKYIETWLFFFLVELLFASSSFMSFYFENGSVIPVFVASVYLTSYLIGMFYWSNIYTRQNPKQSI